MSGPSIDDLIAQHQAEMQAGDNPPSVQGAYVDAQGNRVGGTITPQQAQVLGALVQNKQWNTNAPAGSMGQPYFEQPDQPVDPANAKGNIVRADGTLILQPGSNDVTDRGMSSIGTAEDVGKTIPDALVRGLMGLLGTPGDVDKLGNRYVNNAALSLGQELGFLKPEDAQAQQAANAQYKSPLPSSADFVNGIQNLTGHQLYQPQTKLGQYVGAAAEMAPSIVGGEGSWPGKMFTALASGVGGQAAKDLSGGNELIGALGAGVTGLGTGMLRGMVNPSLKAQANALGPNMDWTKHDAAIDLMRTGEANNVPLAYSQAMGTVNPGTPLLDFERYLRTTPQGKAVADPFYALQDQAARHAMNRFADQLAPQVNPIQLGQQVKDASGKIIGDMRANVNASASPFYEALKGQTVDPALMSTISASDTYQQALAKYLASPSAERPGMAGLPPENAAVMNEVVKKLDARKEGLTPNILKENSDASDAGAVGDLRRTIDDAMAASNPDWARARQTVETGHSTFVQPQQAGVPGALSTIDNPGQQATTAFPRTQTSGMAEPTAQSMRLLSAQTPDGSPDLAAALMAQRLRDSVSNVRGSLPSSVPNNAAAASLIDIAGRPNARSTWEQALGALPDGGDAASRWHDLSRVIDATGQRMNTGSQTTLNGLYEQAMHPDTAGLTALRGIEAWSAPERLANFVAKIQANRNKAKLAEINMSDPDTVNQFMQRIKNGDAKSSTLRQGLLAALMEPSQ